MTLEDLKENIQKYIKLSENISILENIDQLTIDKVADGILTIWVTWSPGFLNCVNAVKLLQDKNYSGQIIIIDNDSVPVDFQKRTFGRVALHGWGEIFEIKDGKIVNEFVGKESAKIFKLQIDKCTNCSL
ncbi:MAG: hypothetical protein UR43_C0010G0036 [candidate division TM6 bacterium GW2011_GWF2_33_332]|nr:MAG: hypothetical protein UR43_C0010G0036 [candidate division TM6 bacterium GW2011_GWF2_33_332]